MLPASRRLRSAETAEVMRRGSFVRGRFLTAKILPGDGTMRVAAVVSKKIAKTAVMRNRTRRIIYDAVARAAPLSLPLRVSFVVHALPPSGDEAALTFDIGDLLARITASAR